MKAIKPLRLGLMYRPIHVEGQPQLALTALAFVDLRSPRYLLPEHKLWEMVAEELGPNAVLDMGVPKQLQEYLVCGKAHPHGSPRSNQCLVYSKVGSLTKALTVFGDRFWNGNQMTEPAPFESMPVDWAHAFGGQGHALNPQGVGTSSEIINGVTTTRLPNVEGMAGRWTQRDRPPQESVGFSAISFDNPKRLQRLGQQYDDDWRKHLFPGFARDMDWRYFNAAPEDQWFDAGETLNGAQYEFGNLHPREPVFAGVLPDLRARAFVARSKRALSVNTPAQGELEEVPMRLTTTWFFPHRERALLVFHGSAPALVDDLREFSHVMVGLETAEMAQRGVEHYHEVFAERVNGDAAAVQALSDDRLLPPDALAPFVEDQLANIAESPLQRNFREAARHAHEKAKDEYVQAGGSAAAFAPFEEEKFAPPSLKDVPAALAEIRRQEEKMLRKLDTSKAKLRRDIQTEAAAAGVDESADYLNPGTASTGVKGPPTFDTQYMLDELKRLTPERADIPHVDGAKSRSQLLRVYRMSAQYQDAVDELSIEKSNALREEVSARMSAGGDLVEMDLTGANLSGMNLHGARLCRALLEGTDLTRTNLDGADLSEAVLVRARMRHTSLKGATLNGVNASKARLDLCNLTGALLDDVSLNGAKVSDCDFSEAKLTACQWMDLVARGCKFDDALLDRVMAVQGCELADSSFRNAVLTKFVWLGGSLKDLNFSGAQLTSCGLAEVALVQRICFDDATLRSTCLVGSPLIVDGLQCNRALAVECNFRSVVFQAASFAQSILRSCDFSEASLLGASFRGADLPSSLFVHADLSKSDFSEADLSEAILQKSVLAGANFFGANLFRADISQALVDRDTCFDETYTEQIKTVPARRSPAEDE